MKFFYICREATRLLARSRLRSFLMLGSSLVGVAGIIVSTNYATAGRTKVVAQLRRMGTEVIVITPRQSKSVAGRARTGAAVTTLRPSDDQAVRRDAPDITGSSEIVSGSFLLDAILLRVSSSDRIQPAVEEVEAVLKHRHRPQPKLPADYQVQNQQQTLDALNASSTRLAFLIRSIGVSGLVVSGLGVFALCWIAIRDRTIELGTRRALGAAASDIFLQIFCEALLVSFSGALLGLAIGYIASRTAEIQTGLPLSFDLVNGIGLVVYSLVLNQVFGIVAARRAAGIDPITALKYE
jgi:ABC-type antimicrobial peptide transport system permease subunit